MIESDLYKREGILLNNFEKILPKADSDLALSILKDPYCFDFLSIREKYDEKELEDAMVNFY